MVIQHLDEHPGNGQEHERRDIGDQQHRNAGKAHTEDDRPQEGHQQGARKRQRQGHKDMHHVDEGRQPQNVRIGPENPEENQGENDNDQQREAHLPIRKCRPAEKIPRQIAAKYRENNDNEIKKQDRPRRQHLGGEYSFQEGVFFHIYKDRKGKGEKQALPDAV